MKKLGYLGIAAALLLAAQVPTSAPAEAKSLGAMINSAINAESGRSAYYNQFRYGYPGYYGYGNPYYGYNYNYGYSAPWYGYRPHHHHHYRLWY